MKKTPSILAPVLGLDPSDMLPTSGRNYNAFTIKSRKKGKAPRAVNAPDDDLKAVQRAILDKILIHVPPHLCATAFFHGRSIAMNAAPHHKCRYLYKTDISDFFGSITANHLAAVLATHFPHLSNRAADEIIGLTMLNGSLPQGAPTSPHLANLVLFDFDARLARLCDRLGARYTRYADDISVSAGDAETLGMIAEFVESGLGKLGLALHPKKTRSYGPEDRKIVTGLDVSADMIRPPRRYRKKTAALVRMCEIYPGRMARHTDRVKGYLAHWQGTAPQDPELAALWQRMKPLIKSEAKAAAQNAPGSFLDDDIPF